MTLETRALMPTELERRGLSRKIEVRKTEQGKFMEGYAAVFYDASKPDETQFRLWNDCYERIMPGAFDNAISRPDDVRCLFNHDESDIYGRTVAGTLTLSIDKVGLRFSCLLPDTDDAGELAVAIERGDLSACSFGFRADDVVWRDVGEMSFRELNDVTLYDVGPVTFPAYAGTSLEIAKRSWSSYQQETRQQAAKRLQRRIRVGKLD